VAEGGHHIPSDVIERRYYRGMSNLVNLYIPICDRWLVIDNTNTSPKEIAGGSFNNVKRAINAYDILSQNKAGMMNNKEKELIVLSDRVMPGMKKVMRKLVETNAAQNKNLVVGDQEGNPISVPAKDLLKTLE
jgi:hypothetical protein